MISTAQERTRATASHRGETPERMLRERPGIAATENDPAWLASMPAGRSVSAPRFPQALEWLVCCQVADRSWDSAARYEHDRIFSTLAALTPLAQFDSADCHTDALQHGPLPAGEPMEPVAFELLLPTLVRRAERASMRVPPNRDIHSSQRAEKLRLIPVEASSAPYTTAVHSFEFPDDQADLEGRAYIESQEERRTLAESRSLAQARPQSEADEALHQLARHLLGRKAAR